MYYILSIVLLSLLCPTNAAPTDPNNSTLIARLPGPDDDGCNWARAYHPWTYANCFESTESQSFGNQIDYTIQMTGTGQNVDKWCQNLESEIDKRCSTRSAFGLNVVYKYTGGCYADQDRLNTVSVDGDDGWKRVTLKGISLGISLVASQLGRPATVPFNAHQCVSDAMAASVCDGVVIGNGAHCVLEGYENDKYEEYDTRPGPTSLDKDPGQA